MGQGEGMSVLKEPQSCLATLHLHSRELKDLLTLGTFTGQLFLKERTLHCLDLISEANT